MATLTAISLAEDFAALSNAVRRFHVELTHRPVPVDKPYFEVEVYYESLAEVYAEILEALSQLGAQLPAGLSLDPPAAARGSRLGSAGVAHRELVKTVGLLLTYLVSAHKVLVDAGQPDAKRLTNMWTCLAFGLVTAVAEFRSRYSDYTRALPVH